MAIASCLVDTNILLRTIKRSLAQHDTISIAIARLAALHTPLYYTHQNIAEFWNTMTRPTNRNGLGFRISDADREVQRIESALLFLPDSAAVYREWRRLVVHYSVSGVQVHDARLAAAMLVHGIGHILTLNVSDFNRFAGLIAVHPDNI